LALDSFANLKAAIASWLNRTDLTAAIPDFITLAEAQMNRDIRHPKMEERVTASLSAQYLTLPANWLETIRMQIGGQYGQLQQISYEAMQDYRWRNNDASGIPGYFCHVAGQIEVYPTPNDTFSAELVYYERIPSLSDSVTSNWLLASSPDVYLYGSLLQSAPYLVEDQRIMVWQQFYDRAVTGLDTEAGRARTSSGMRMRVRA
jgi:hypothetical protein